MPNPDNVPQTSVHLSNQPEDGAMDVMEAQLQQELRGMFDIDTQKGLQTYLEQATRLQPQTWRNDIQTLYRTIHTIKGGAVTVGANAILQVATVLEDLLSDLRHLETAPLLEDGSLEEALIEAGELLASTLSLETPGESTRVQVAPSVQRIETLRSQIQQRYLPQWSEEQQIQQDFARQGLDLVVLDLEIALENLPPQGRLPDSILYTARKITDQLYQIGHDLQLSSGWGVLLNQAEFLLQELDVDLWRTQWPRLFQALKACAQAGGQSVAFELSLPTPPAAFPTDNFSQAEAVSATLSTAPDPASAENDNDFTAVFTDMGTFLEGLSGLEDALESPSNQESILTNQRQPDLEDDLEAELDPEEWAIESTTDSLGVAEAVPVQDATAPEKVAPESAPTLSDPIESDGPIQIPIPLEKLDQSAQNLVNTLLSVRSTQGIYQGLQTQVLQLATLAQEGVQHITHLRQIQDDYALMDGLKVNLQDAGPTPERYRQGYIAINRLLETSLRLSELGAEAEKSAKQMTESLQFLDGSVLKLQDTINESRLVPFGNLAFRARAILRDLTTRFKKPARLVVRGERTDLDVGTVRSLEPALLHLIRNAFSHALESPEVRQAQGKPEQGTLTLSLQRLGNTYQLDFQDDGSGIDPEKIRDRAIALGLPLNNTSTAADLLAVICQPGFSSDKAVSDVSGRGVGMDVVIAQISQLGGRLTLETAPGVGTTFHLQFPVPHLLVSCVLLQAGDLAFAIPTEDIRTVALLESLEASPSQDRETLYSWQIAMADKVVPGLDLLEYWRPQAADRVLGEAAVCAYVQSLAGDQGVWLIADELLGQSDLLINSLPAPLQPPAGMMGASLQPDGTLMPVLDASAIVQWLYTVPQDALSELSGLSDLGLEETTIYTPTILIVDDAALMRRRLEASLTSYGHLIHTCGDGLEAWNWLKINPAPALIITDIEMPNMDGFTLIDRCRQEGMTMPILVVSSRLSEEWFDEAKRLGANDYLTKGFSTLELMTKTEQLLSWVV